ncbi:glycosyltransferase family 4 protein [Compostibacter hankyongensis]|uniref:Glycosyltransferase family 4 protein n=1 Tax=Compostibacter hankyongensis TaxID=1007089 RepID=A0ABP8FW76_9BACT
MSLLNAHTLPRIFTWHIHGSYLYYLSQGSYEIFIPVDRGRSEGYCGRGNTIPFGENVHEVAAEKVKEMSFDCILFQSQQNYITDQYEILSPVQRALPRIYVEHDPPRKHPTDTRHVVDDPEVILVHVTHFNKLMWENPSGLVKVIEHGVTPPAVAYSGILEKGVVVVNNLPKRGRRLGADIFLEARKHIPLDLVGMGSEAFGGLGEVPLTELPAFLSRYRFFFNPIRYTSLGLSVCEAMMLGMPVIGLATTEMVTVVENGVTGYVDTDPHALLTKMKALLQHRELAERLGSAGKKVAEERFGIHRFTREWAHLFHVALKRNEVFS